MMVKVLASAFTLSAVAVICALLGASRVHGVGAAGYSVGIADAQVLSMVAQKVPPCAPRGFKPFTNQNLLQNFSFNTVGPLGTSTNILGSSTKSFSAFGCQVLDSSQQQRRGCHQHANDSFDWPDGAANASDQNRWE
jgi:hypothetical protein